MKLSEIRAIYKSIYDQIPRQTQSLDEISQFVRMKSDSAPRIPFEELPQSLQKHVRESITPDSLRAFLIDCLSADEFNNLTVDIPENDLHDILIWTRNHTTYTIQAGTPLFTKTEDGYILSDMPDIDKLPLIPNLYGDYAINTFTTAVCRFRSIPVETETDKKTGKTTQRKKQMNHAARAAANKDIVSAGYYQINISDKKYKHALTTQKNRNAYIALMDEEFFQKFDFSNGELIYDGAIAGQVKQHIRGRYEDVSAIDFPLLVQIYTAAVKAKMKYDSFTITVYIPTFFKEMGIDTGTGNASDFMRKLHSFENCAGFLPGSSTISKLLSIIDMDMKHQTITFAIPYIMRLITLLNEQNLVKGKTRNGDEYEYIKPHHNTLIHSTIVAERNKPAVELLGLITTGLLQRGAVPDTKTYRKNNTQTTTPELVTYSETFRTLLNDAPLLRGRIQAYKTTADKNKALRRAFSRMWELLPTKTDAEQYFINLHYNAIIPTMTTLGDILEITHTGINGKYSQKK